MNEEYPETECPKCGAPMYYLENSSRVQDGVKTIDLICENCLHVEERTFVVVDRKEW